MSIKIRAHRTPEVEMLQRKTGIKAARNICFDLEFRTVTYQNILHVCKIQHATSNRNV